MPKNLSPTFGERLFVPILIAICAFAAGCGSSGSSGSSSHPKYQAVACSDLTTLRSLGDRFETVTNSRTGDTLDYLVIGDGALSNELLVMFNGTGEIAPDWPMQMITNKKYSPKIVHTLDYRRYEDGPISLCHDYRLVIFDYPGVGNNPLPGPVTFDQVANDVDAMLNDISTNYGIDTSVVDPIGWSLGTSFVQKFSFLSPTANPARTIKDVVLIATEAGGSTQGVSPGNAAPCIDTMFNELENNPDLDKKLKSKLDVNLFELTFPYVGQTPYDGADSGCTATIDTDNNTVDLSVKPDCPLGSECKKNLHSQDLNRRVEPWSKTKGIDYDLYVQQRELANDHGMCYCTTPNADFTSTGCTCTGPVQMSSSNGGICQTTANTIYAPVVDNCDMLQNTGKITVLNGPEDILIQWTYGQAFVDAYNAEYGANKAAIFTYPLSDGAGHGVMLQHPLWTQTEIFAALND